MKTPVQFRTVDIHFKKELYVQRKMKATVTVHPKNSDKVVISRNEIIGVERRLTPDGKERTFLAIGNLGPLNLDLEELKKVEKSSVIL